jgi:hypothetical protein
MDICRHADALIGHGPESVLTHGHEGGHVDVEATGVRHAVTIRVLMEVVGYHRRCGHQRVGRFLPARRFASRAIVLPGVMRRIKQEMYACFQEMDDCFRRTPCATKVPMAVERFR